MFTALKVTSTFLKATASIPTNSTTKCILKNLGVHKHQLSTLSLLQFCDYNVITKRSVGNNNYSKNSINENVYSSFSKRNFGASAGRNLPTRINAEDDLFGYTGQRGARVVKRRLPGSVYKMNMVSKMAVGMKVDKALATPTLENMAYFCKSFSTSTTKSIIDEYLILEEGEQAQEVYDCTRKVMYVADKGRSIVEDVDVIGDFTGDNSDHHIAAEIFNSIKKPKLKRYVIEENIEKYVKYTPKINKILQEALFHRALEEDYVLGKRVLDAFLDSMPQITEEPYVTNMLNVLMMQTRYQKRRRNFHIRDQKTCIGYFHEYVDNKGVKPDTVTCHLLMANYLDSKDTVYKALEFFEHMSEARIPYDEKLFNQFIVKLSLLNNSIDSAYEYLYKMQLAGITKKY